MHETTRETLFARRVSRRALFGGGAGALVALAVVGLRSGSVASDVVQASRYAPGVMQRHPAACACPTCKRSAPDETLMA